jgi:NADH:ubiquinone oxidoreductase subunit H
MSTFGVAFLILLGLFLGAYSVSVLERLIDLGLRHFGTAVISPLSTTVALLRQEDLEPRGADRLLFRSAPLVALAAVALAALVIPLGPGLQGFDPAIGLFYFIVVLGPFVIAMMNAGWGQNAKEGLFGSFRAAAHLLSYEVPLGFAAIGPAMAAESLSTVRIIEAQAGLWYAVWDHTPLSYGNYR